MMGLEITAFPSDMAASSDDLDVWRGTKRFSPRDDDAGERLVMAEMLRGWTGALHQHRSGNYWGWSSLTNAGGDGLLFELTPFTLDSSSNYWVDYLRNVITDYKLQ